MIRRKRQRDRQETVKGLQSVFRRLQNRPVAQTKSGLSLRKFSAAMVFLTRVEHFNAAHKLYNPNWTPEKNEEVFGKCANANWHGHNYELYVTVKGRPHPDTGFVMDVKKLSELVRELVVEKVDHRNLNLDVDFLEGQFPSTENLAIGIWNQLVPHLPSDVALHCIKLYETPRIYVEYYGDAG